MPSINVQKDVVLVKDLGYTIEIDRSAQPLMLYIFRAGDVEPIHFISTEGRTVLGLIHEAYTRITNDRRQKRRKPITF